MPGSKVGIVQAEAQPTADNLQVTAANLREHVPALNACLTHTVEAVDGSHQNDVTQLKDLTAEGARHVGECADSLEEAVRLLRSIEADL